MVATLPDGDVHPAFRELELRRQRLAEISARAALNAIQCRQQREQLLAKSATPTPRLPLPTARTSEGIGPIGLRPMAMPSPRNRAMPWAVDASGPQTAREPVFGLEMLGALPDEGQATVSEKIALWRERVNVDDVQPPTLASARLSRNVLLPQAPAEEPQASWCGIFGRAPSSPSQLPSIPALLEVTPERPKRLLLQGPPSESDEHCHKSKDSAQKDLLTSALERLDRLERQLEEERASTRSMVANYERRLQEGDETHRRDVERLSSLVQQALSRQQGDSMGSSGTTTLPSTGNSDLSGDEDQLHY